MLKWIKIVSVLITLFAVGLFVAVLSVPSTGPSKSAESAALKGSVSIQGMSFVLENKDGFDWTDCEFTVNPEGFSGKGFDVAVPSVAAHSIREIESTSLAAADGARFDLFTHKAKSVVIACSTPAGRAYEGLEFTGR